jgi:WD40 repeat protein
VLFLVGCNFQSQNSPTPTKVTTPTLIISKRTQAQPQGSATATQTQTKEPIKIARILRDNSGILLLDENINIVKKIPYNEDINTAALDYRAVLNDYAFDPFSCEIIEVGYFYEARFNIEVKDFHGRVTQTITPKLVEQPSGYRYSISPDKKWLIYTIVGNEGYGPADSQYQQLKIVKIDEQIPQKATQLTRNAGAFPAIPTWSPDGKMLAYTDFDGSGAPQLFVLDLENGELKKITNIIKEKTDQFISLLKWSTDSKRIAFVLTDIEKNQNEYLYTQGQLGVITSDGNEFQWLNIGNPPIEISYLWWGIKNNLLINAEKPSSPDYDQILWMNVGDEKITNTLKAAVSTGPVNLDLSEITLYSNEGRMKYSVINDTFSPIQEPETEGLSQWVLSPSGGMVPYICYYP